jgi:hypothetical protein
MKRLGFVTGILAAYLFVKRARSSYAARKAARVMSSASFAQMMRELDGIHAHTGEAPYRWIVGIPVEVADPDQWNWAEKPNTYMHGCIGRT